MQKINYRHIHTDLVLIGSGHTNLNVLNILSKNPLPGVRITLITDVLNVTYSGMLYGYLTSDFSFEDSHIDVNRYANKQNIRIFHSSVTGLDIEKRLILCDNRPPVSYDYLSINCGSVQNLDHISGAKEFAVQVKPMNKFLKKVDDIIEQIKTFRGIFHLLVVGGGATGVELSVAMRTRINYEMRNINLIPDTVKVFLCIPEEKILPKLNGKTVQESEKILKDKNIFVLNHSKILSIEEELVYMADRKQMAADSVILATEGTTPDWVKQSELETNPNGFILTRPTLQSKQDPNIYVSGDAAAFETMKVEKSGVYAVKMAKTLAENIHAVLSKKKPSVYVPQKKSMYILGLDKEVGVLNYGKFSFTGTWVKNLKNRIDKNYIRKFTYAPVSQIDVSKINPEDRMRCGGCGGKVGYNLLKDTLQNLNNIQQPDVLQGIGEQSDSSCIEIGKNKYLYQSVDFFREVLDDPYIFGQLTAIHCLNDIYAAKAHPHSALAVMGIPYGKENIRQRDMSSMLNGITNILSKENASLIGGHTAEADEFYLGLSVNGFSEKSPAEKNNVETGYKLILTKKIGAGVLFAAEASGDCSGKYKEELLAELLHSSQKLSTILHENNDIVCTDVTGFGLLGSIYNLLQRSPQSIHLNLNRLPVFSGVQELLKTGYLSSMDRQNKYFESNVENLTEINNHPLFNVLFDPQTAGPLLLFVPNNKSETVLNQIHSQGYSNAEIIGEVQSTDAAQPVFYITE